MTGFIPMHSAHIPAIISDKKGLPPEKWIPALFSAWDRAGITYCVLRNYESLPHSMGNDLDVLVPPSRLSDAVTVLRQKIEELGGTLHHRAPFGCVSIFFHEQGLGRQFHVDVFDKLTWRCFPLLPVETCLARRRSFREWYVLAEADEALLNLFNHLLNGSGIRDKYKPQIESQAEAAEFEEQLCGIVGRAWSDRTLSWIRTGRWHDIECHHNRFRWAVGWRACLKEPGPVAKRFFGDLRRLLHRAVRPPGLFVVMVGPDGSGKSSAGVALRSWLSGTFYPERSVYFHWKARLIKQETVPTGPPRTNPHGEALRSSMASLIFFAAHVAELLSAHWVKVWPRKFKNGFVIIDRYYYDFFVDPQRYRLQLPARLVSLVYWLVPKPDLIFFFDAAPQVLQARKQEVGFEECRRQREAYQALAVKLPQAVVVDAQQSLDEVAMTVLQCTLHHLESKMNREWPSGRSGYNDGAPG